MSRRGIAVLLIAAAAGLPASSALLPDYFHQVAKSGSAAAPPPDPALFEEYGFDQSERGTYGGMTVTSWRFRDTTGAVAAFQYLRPTEAKPCDMGKTSACVGSREAIVAVGNYVIQFSGALPKGEEVNLFLYAAPRLQMAPPPTLAGFLPEEGKVPNSERYVLGPVGLERFGPGIPPSAVAFSLSAEGQRARYRVTGGEADLLLFSYPTPNMARDQFEALRQISGAIAKRTGPLVAVIPAALNRDDAERLLARINYDATITMNQLPARNQAVGWASALLSMFALAGVILAFCLVSGLAFGAFRVLMRRTGHGGDEQAMIRLGLDRP